MEALRPLGKGGFGRVDLVRSRLDFRLMAIKQVRGLVSSEMAEDQNSIRLAFGECGLMGTSFPHGQIGWCHGDCPRSTRSRT